MEKLFKLMSLTLLTALISSCNLFKPYEVIYETKMRNYKSNEINYDDFISLSLIIAFFFIFKFFNYRSYFKR